MSSRRLAVVLLCAALTGCSNPLIVGYDAALMPPAPKDSWVLVHNPKYGTIEARNEPEFLWVLDEKAGDARLASAEAARGRLPAPGPIHPRQRLSEPPHPRAQGGMHVTPLRNQSAAQRAQDWHDCHIAATVVTPLGPPPPVSTTDTVVGIGVAAVILVPIGLLLGPGALSALGHAAPKPDGPVVVPEYEAGRQLALRGYRDCMEARGYTVTWPGMPAESTAKHSSDDGVIAGIRASCERRRSVDEDVPTCEQRRLDAFRLGRPYDE